MSMLDSVGGLAGGLGSSGGVGGQIPSNSSAATASASVAVNPNTTLSGAIGGGGNQFGPFSVNFPGAGYGTSSDINSPPFTTSLFAKPAFLFAILGAALLVLVFMFKR